jgi:hypothetical protein
MKTQQTQLSHTMTYPIRALLLSIFAIETRIANSFGIPLKPFINAPDPDIGELIVGVVGAFVVIVVGVNLVGPTATTVGGAIKSGNVTAIGGLVSILQVTVLIFGIIVLVAAVVFISVITNKAKQV